MFYSKKIPAILISFALLSPLFSDSEDGRDAVFIKLSEPSKESTIDSEEEDIDEDEGTDEIEDLDSMFEDSEDLEEAVITEDNSAGTSYDVQLGSIKFPIEFSGHLGTEFGGAVVRKDHDTDGTFYFDLKNYLYFTTRPDKYIALKGVLKSSLPNDSTDKENYQLLYLYELYFDYLMFNRIYITAGKKGTAWGNTRLFSNSDDYSGDTDALYTNILYDSRNYISGIMRVPFWNNQITGVIMYNDSSSGTSPTTKDMSFAGSIDFVILSTSINIFGRRFPKKDGNDSENHQSPILGMEMKRTILGFDVYGQSMARLENYRKLKELISSKLEDKSSISKIISTAGIYRFWSDSTPNFGFNFEFQNIYRPNPDDGVEKFTNRFAFDFGMSKLGPNRDIRIGCQWCHDITAGNGFIKTGFSIAHILPHCDWRTGIEYDYGELNTSFEKYKLTIGTYFTITLDY